MQLIKQPFYYNPKKLNSLTYLKILNIQYYSKFIICAQIIESLGVYNIIKFKRFKLKKKKRQKKQKIKFKKEKFISDLFLDINNSIEYLDDDFFYKNKTQTGLGFSYKFQDKYFANYKVLNSDFIEKYFKFNFQKNYLTSYYKNLKFLSIKNQYKLLIPLRPHKGGFISFGFGFKGFINGIYLRYIDKKQLYYNIKNSWMYITTLVFTSSKINLVIRHKKFARRKKFKSLNKKLKRSKLKRRLKVLFLSHNIRYKSKIHCKKNTIKKNKEITKSFNFKQKQDTTLNFKKKNKWVKNNNYKPYNKPVDIKISKKKAI